MQNQKKKLTLGSWTLFVIVVNTKAQETFVMSLGPFGSLSTILIPMKKTKQYQEIQTIIQQKN